MCLGGPAGGVHVLSNSLVVMSLQIFYSLGPSCGFCFCILKNLFLMQVLFFFLIYFKSCFFRVFFIILFIIF